ncbi:TonB-dependent siderophore receptor [Nisaea acidiphila]|uniref:TonB-dependent siderophore receptor n=1 Tax=Nisaea acidiphila TaxID=1862145 RepID=A0A9J7ANM7_9PROT|nr:TonB-dependent siderophore receptor [Nisaea acidiphila]UUX49024.1 TonB-dependent siderophore receptor [Nisaea acidiphila]
MTDANEMNRYGRKMLRAFLLGTVCVGALAQAGPARAQSSGEAVTLDRIVVEGDEEVVTEDTGSYASSRSTVGYKQPTDIREIPQTVNVLTRQRLDDANATTLEEAGYLLPNVTTATGNGFDGSLYSRGHEVFTYNVDGAPRSFLSLYGTAPDLVFFDRVEVLSGPSGVFQGSGEPVGTINLVRKRPNGENGGSATGHLGTYDNYRGEADLQVAGGDRKQVRGRLIGYGFTKQSYLDIAQQDKGGGYGTVEYDVTEDLTVSFGGIHESEDTVSMSGQPTFSDGSFLNVGTETFFGAPWNQREINTAEGFADAEYTFDNGGVLKLNSRIYDRDTNIKNALASTSVDASTGDFTMFVFARRFDEKTSYLDLNYAQPFTFFERRSEFAIGTDYRRTEQDMKQNFDFSLGTQNINTFNPYDLVEPEITYPGVGPGFRLNTETETDEFGGYGYARLQVYDGLNLTLGGRYAVYDSETEDTGRSTVTSIDENRFVPMVGLSYDIVPEATVYTSYSEIFQPQSEQKADGSQLDPIEGRQVEIGTKVSLFDGFLQGQAAVYWLQDENRAADDPDNVGSFVESQEEDTVGFEISLAGSPYPGVEISAGYSYVDTDLDTDPTPEHSGVIWGRYTFLEGPLQDLYVGAGVQAVGDFEAISNGVKIDAPGYAVVNAAAGYPINENFEIGLFVENLLDNEYVERVNNTTARGVFYGDPLTATFRLTGRF